MMFGNIRLPTITENAAGNQKRPLRLTGEEALVTPTDCITSFAYADRTAALPLLMRGSLGGFDGRNAEAYLPIYVQSAQW